MHDQIHYAPHIVLAIVDRAGAGDSKEANANGGNMNLQPFSTIVSVISQPLKKASSCALVLAALLAASSSLASPASEEFGRQIEAKLRSELLMCRKKYGNDSPQTADALEYLANSWALRHSHSTDDERISLFREALPIRKRNYNPAKFVDAFGHTGMVTMKTPGAEYAGDLWQIGKMLEASRPQAKRNGAARAIKKKNVVLQIQVNDLDAVAIWKELVQMSSKSLGPEHPTTVDFMIDLGQCESAAEDYNDAEKTLMQVLSIERKRNLKPDQYSRESWCLCTLRNMYVDSENDKKAEPVLKQEIEYQNRCEPEGPFMAGILEMYSELLRRESRVAEAIPMEQHAAKIRQKTGAHQEHQVTAKIIKPVAK